MSDVSRGPGWWLASDGKWYSPEQKPGPLPPMDAPGAGSFVPGAGPSAGPDSSPTSPGYGPPPSAPTYYPPTTPPGYGAPPPMAAGYAYPSGGASYGYTPEKTNGLAIAGFVCSLFFWIYGVGAVLGIIFGFIARSQIKRSGHTQKGSGLALAGIIIGFVGIAIGIILIIVLIAVVHHCDQNADGFCTNNTVSFGN